MDGVLNIYKHPGPTSHDIVDMARRALNMKKIGHAGTLDPLAEGVLILCIGKGTRLSDYLSELPKEYLAEITFGITTSTYDAEGEITSKCDKEVFEEEVREVLNEFVGEIEQVPPPSSAIRYKGKRLYEYAREGIPVEPPPRRVTIYSLELVDFNKAERKGIFRINCSKGTYIRALARDIGEKIGTGAYLSKLIRTRVGPFSAEEALPASELKRENSSVIKGKIMPLVDALPHFPLYMVDHKQAFRISTGAYLPIKRNLFPLGKYIRVVSPDRQLISIAKVEVKEGQFYLKPEKVFAYEW
ncbi:tRNA pseudouridine(55) synthase TruB [bacterium]|nr:tRNA pseudouridine(55) synthase TruB [bacterium]